jgi:hypothetical protein
MEEQSGQISPYAYLLSAAFMVWMLVDAWRRRAPLHWYFIIVVMPFGAVFYFVVIKLRDFREGAARNSLGPIGGPALGFPGSIHPAPASLERADAFEANEQYSDAEPLYRAALETDASNKRALHGLGRCLLGAGNATDSLVYFERLMELDRTFAGYGAALDYADALWAANQKHDTIELLERLADVTGRINHRLALGHYLAEFGQVERAKQEIERAIAEATGPIAPFNERQRQWVDRGRQMLAELSEGSAAAPTDTN